jgi:hypothetical protein
LAYLPIDLSREPKILEDARDNLWLGTYGGGLCLFDGNLETFRRFQHDPENPATLCNDYVIDLIWEDEQNLSGRKEVSM